MKLNRVISESFPEKNPEEEKIENNLNGNSKQIKSCRLISGYKKISKNGNNGENKFSDSKICEMNQEDGRYVSEKNSLCRKE
jgi:hypothetical protein